MFYEIMGDRTAAKNLFSKQVKTIEKAAVESPIIFLLLSFLPFLTFGFDWFLEIMHINR